MDGRPWNGRPQTDGCGSGRGGSGTASGSTWTKGGPAGVPTATSRASTPPTLDGLGAVGDGAHARHEHIRIEETLDRCALLALLLMEPPLAEQDQP